MGDIVLVRDPLSESKKWPLGRVVKLYGDHDTARLVEVKFANQTIKTKSTSQLVRIPIGELNSSVEAVMASAREDV